MRKKITVEPSYVSLNVKVVWEWSLWKEVWEWSLWKMCYWGRVWGWSLNRQANIVCRIKRYKVGSGILGILTHTKVVEIEPWRGSKEENQGCMESPTFPQNQEIYSYISTRSQALLKIIMKKPLSRGYMFISTKMGGFQCSLIHEGRSNSFSHTPLNMQIRPSLEYFFLWLKHRSPERPWSMEPH